MSGKTEVASSVLGPGLFWSNIGAAIYEFLYLTNLKVSVIVDMDILGVGIQTPYSPNLYTALGINHCR